MCSYNFEDEILKAIRLKDLSLAIDIYEKHCSKSELTLSGESFVRSLKNQVICTIYYIGKSVCQTPCSKLKELTASYIRKIESEGCPDEILSIGREALAGFSNFISFNSLNCSNILIFETIEYIESNLNSDLSLEVLSSRVHVSKNYLSSMFIKHTGMRVTSFINKLRVSRAKEFLESEDYSLEYISSICGFKNQSYFSTVFKKIELKTPMEYRSKCSNK